MTIIATCSDMKPAGVPLKVQLAAERIARKLRKSASNVRRHMLLTSHRERKKQTFSAIGMNSCNRITKKKKHQEIM